MIHIQILISRICGFFRRALDQQHLADLIYTREELEMARDEIDRQLEAINARIAQKIDMEAKKQ